MTQKVKKNKKRALGKGIAALIPDMGSFDEVDYQSDNNGDNNNKVVTLNSKDADGTDSYFDCDINKIVPNRYQPRQHFSKEELKELSGSIREQGVIQPLLVRKSDVGYELIAGERRLRASKMAGITTIPVIVKDISDRQMLEVSIIENVQRQDLNPMEEAKAYQRLSEEFNLTQDEIAVKVSKSRSAVTNFIRLLKLPIQIRDSISKNTISVGHARALLGVDEHDKQIEAWQLVIAKGLTVRQTETLVKQLKAIKKEPDSPLPNPDKQYLSGIAQDISTFLGTDVQISKKGNKGKVQIAFKDNDELERLLSLFKKEI